MRNYLIIGASSGIGYELAKILSEKGNQVFATYNKNPPAASSQISFHPLNVLDEEYDLSFLPDQLDGVVYCPGSINLMPFTRIKPKAFSEDFELQVTGAIRIIQSTLNLLKKSEKASIVLFSTVAVQSGFNFHSQVAASKGAIEGLTRALAAEFAPTIRVNAVAPSITDTPLAKKYLSNDDKKEANAQRHPLKKIGDPKNVAETADFLLSEQSSWITGQILHVDGGMSTLKL